MAGLYAYVDLSPNDLLVAIFVVLFYLTFFMNECSGNVMPHSHEGTLHSGGGADRVGD